jgi:hypothetical protein
MTILRSLRAGVAILGVAVAASTLGGAAPTAEATGLTIVPRKPDVAVTATGHSGGITDSYMTVAFAVTNKYQPADNVQLKSQCNYKRINDGSSSRTEAKPTILISLPANQPLPVQKIVTCSPLGGEFVSAVLMQAVVPIGDSNPANNTATWDYLTGK